MFTDKYGRLKSMEDTEHVILELGCGSRRVIHGSVTIDMLDFDCVDVVGNVFEVLAAIPDACVDLSYSSHFAEHIEDFPTLMFELARVSKPGGRVRLVVPHFSNPYFYSDPTHRSNFGLYSLSYFARDGLFRRQVPSYWGSDMFVLSNVRLIFRTPRPFYAQYLYRRAIQAIVNLRPRFKEVYEFSFCYRVPCYEVDYELVRL